MAKRFLLVKEGKIIYSSNVYTNVIDKYNEQKGEIYEII